MRFLICTLRGRIKNRILAAATAAALGCTTMTATGMTAFATETTAVETEETTQEKQTQPVHDWRDAIHGNTAEVDSNIAKLPADWPEAPDISAPSAAVFEVKSGELIYAKEATKPWYPSSLTKIMTGLLACENLMQTEKITFSRDAIFTYMEKGANNIALNPGEVLTVEDCMYAMLLPSANEAANGLAEQVSGNVPEFVSRMNSRAAELKTVNTHFTNANGLHDENQYSCAYDLGLIYLACIQNPTFLRINSSPTYTIQPTNLQKEARPIKTTDDMLNRYSGAGIYEPKAICGKTGNSLQAGKNLVTYASDGTMELVVVVLGETDKNVMYEDTKKLMSYGFEQFQTANIARNDKEYSNVNNARVASPITIPKQDISLFHMSTNDYVVLPKNATFDQLESSLVYQENAENQFASIRYVYKGFEVGFGHLMVSDITLTKEEFDSVVNHELQLEEIEYQDPYQEEKVDFSLKKGALGWYIAMTVLILLLILVIVFFIMFLVYRSGGGKGKRGRGGKKHYDGPNYRGGSKTHRKTHIV